MIFSLDMSLCYLTCIGSVFAGMWAPFDGKQWCFLQVWWTPSSSQIWGQDHASDGNLSMPPPLSSWGMGVRLLRVCLHSCDQIFQGLFRGVIICLVSKLGRSEVWWFRLSSSSFAFIHNFAHILCLYVTGWRGNSVKMVHTKQTS